MRVEVDVSSEEEVVEEASLEEETSLVEERLSLALEAKADEVLEIVLKALLQPAKRSEAANKVIFKEECFMIFPFTRLRSIPRFLLVKPPRRSLFCLKK